MKISRDRTARCLRHVAAGAVVAVAMTAARAEAQSGAQRDSVPDAQVESNVLRALAGVPGLTNQKVNSVTVYGVVTLSGTVEDEPTRSAVETAVSRTAGVKKVIDELTIPGESGTGAGPSAASDAGAAPSNMPGDNPAPGDGGNRRVLLSDGTTAAEGSQAGPPADGNQAPALPGQDESLGQQPLGTPDGVPNGEQQVPVQRPYGTQQAGPGSPYPAGQQQPYGRPGQPGQQVPYGPGRAPYSGPYPGQSQPPYQAGRPVYGAQIGGQPVTVPNGSMLRIRTSQGFNSKNTQPGTPFEGVVLNDVVADGAVAIPRGASVQGVVTESHRGGALKGRGELTLTLTGVNLAGRHYPLTTDVWSNYGADKTGRTVGNAIGLGALGAIIGAVAGGGPGAAVGAGLGGAAGVGTSAASGGGQAMVPAEAILTFHLTQPAPLETVSQAEMDRLGYGVAPARQMVRRAPPAGYGSPYGPPPPPPSPYARY